MALAPDVRPSVNHLQGAPPEDRDSVERVAACVESFEQGIGPDFRDRCERYFRQYRSFSRFKSAWEAAGPNDRDGVLLDAKASWGANLHVPLSFRTIETMVPRAVAQRPRMIYLPRLPEYEENVGTVRHLIDAQQDQIDIDLPFQAIMRSGRMYGLGVGKSYWRKEYASRRVVQRRTFRPKDFVVGPLQQQCVFDDPDFEDVDVFDFMWDPVGSAMQGANRAKWVVHRVWLDLQDCLDRVESGAWNTGSVQALRDGPDLEQKLRSMGSGQKYSEIWQARMLASGFNSYHLATRGEQLHEVWEWHDGDRVLTVLDRQVLVQDAENPCVGQLPFVVYRPTPLQKQMVGIGDLEPLEHLQRELDTMRSQRRDAATIALCAGYAYDTTYIDEEDLTFGPAAAIPVRNAGDISRALMPLPVRDVPGSTWQDEQIIRQDFDAVSGISDSMDPSQGTASTATEAQLVQASLSARIELGSRRFEIEVVRHAARAFLWLDQRMITRNRQPIRQPADGYDVTTAAQEGRWQWFPVGPGELRGEFEIIAEGGSMAAKNVPQERQDGVQAMQLFGSSPYIDQRPLLLYALRKMGIENGEAWLKQTDAPVPPAALQMLQDAGVDPALIQQAVFNAQQADPRLAQQGPDSSAVANMMSGSG